MKGEDNQQICNEMDKYALLVATNTCDMSTKRLQHKKGEAAGAYASKEKETPGRKKWLKILDNMVTKLEVSHFYLQSKLF
jgi:hypothetical protein